MGAEFDLYLARREKARASKAIRVPPLPHVGCAAPGCHLCGEEVNRWGGRARRWHDGRHGEPYCLAHYRFATNMQNAMRDWLAWRDQGACASCGRACAIRLVADRTRPDSLWEPDDRAYYGYVHLRTVELWHADHIVPLWRVDRSLPWPTVFRYWLPDNVQTLCDRCHKAKTAREAGYRAAWPGDLAVVLQ